MYNRMVNADHIFSLFGSGDDLDGNSTSKTYMDFKETPLYWVGMFKKTVLNHVNFNKKLIKFFQKANEELNIHEVQEAGEDIIYKKAWNYIKKVDLAKVNVEDILSYITDLAIDAGYVEEPALMAA